MNFYFQLVQRIVDTILIEWTNFFSLVAPMFGDENKNQIEKMNKEKTQERRQTFHEMDQNKDGFLTTNEISVCTNNLLPIFHSIF